MHPRLEHLLSLRDGEPVDARVRDHVAACAECAETLRGVAAVAGQLRALPAAPARADGWDDVRRRLASRERSARSRRAAGAFATAASIGVIALAISWRLQEPAAPGDARATAVAAADAGDADIERLQSESQALDALLAALGGTPAVERAGSAVPIDTIEAQVQWLDHQLSAAAAEPLAPASAEELWRERVELMNSLVQLRYVEAQSVTL